MCRGFSTRPWGNIKKEISLNNHQSVALKGYLCGNYITLCSSFTFQLTTVTAKQTHAGKVISVWPTG